MLFLSLNVANAFVIENELLCFANHGINVNFNNNELKHRHPKKNVFNIIFSRSLNFALLLAKFQ